MTERTIRISFKVSPEEQELLKERMKKEGYKTMSEFSRATVVYGLPCVLDTGWRQKAAALFDEMLKIGTFSRACKKDFTSRARKILFDVKADDVCR